LSNRKAAQRKGQVQLIDATQWYKPLRKNLGKKNCELGEDDIARICQTYLEFKESEQSKIFDNAAFGYWKVAVERPKRLKSQLTLPAIETLRFASGDAEIRTVLYDEFGDALVNDFRSIQKKLDQRLNDWGAEEEADDEGEEAPAKKGLPEKKKKKLLDAATWGRDATLVEIATFLREQLGGEVFGDHNIFRERVEAALEVASRKVGSADLKLIYKAVSWRDETAPPVIAKTHKPGKLKADPLHGLYETTLQGKKVLVEYEPDTDLRDTEQVPLLEDGGIEAFIRREVLPYTADAWVDESKTKIGYEISFTRHFYKPQPLRTLEEIRADILAVEKDAEGMLAEIIGGGEVHTI
jgi:type I restriction enzyme M protein